MDSRLHQILFCRGKCRGTGYFTGNPVIQFSGKFIALGPLCKDYMDIYMKCYNEFKTNRTKGKFKSSIYKLLL